MNRIFKLEIKRAFRNRLFAATLCVAFAICVWHFMENVWIWRMYIYSDTYPLSAYEKWIGADNASVQPLLLYLIMPALCAIPYGRSFYFDVKSGYAAQIISRGKKSDYIRAKYGAAFVSGALIGMIPLMFDFLLTAMVFPVENCCISIPISMSISSDFVLHFPIAHVTAARTSIIAA